MSRVVLTDRFITSPKRVPPSGRKDYADALVPGFALRVTSTGHRSFVLIARFPFKPKNPTRRALGDYGALSLEEGRAKAREWLALIKQGVDPKAEEARLRAERQRRQINTFAAVAHEFLDRVASKLAHERQARRIMQGEFVSRWGDRSITDITPEEVAATLRVIARRAPGNAHNILGWLRRLYNWAIGTHEFGLEKSPLERLRPRDLIGPKQVRERVLTNAELREVWRASDDLGYPYGPLFRLLILTGQRLREVGAMAWSEVDLDAKVWTIPASRMKGGRAHEVPLGPMAIALLNDLPRFTGPYVFTTRSGARPVNGFSKAKTRADNSSDVKDWTLHDLRRTMRTGLSALPVEDLVRELVIAHARPGLHRVYDQHAYLEEKRECLLLWEHRLGSILEGRQTAARRVPAPTITDM